MRGATTKVIQAAKPGMTTYDFDEIIKQHIFENDAIPTFLGYRQHGGKPFPGASCQSVNNVLVHGIPSKRKKLKKGDIISIDVGVTKDGYIADSCISFGIGKISAKKQALINASKEITLYGIGLVKAGVHVHKLSTKIAQKTKELGYVTAPDLLGHGTGIELHEKPAIPFVENPDPKEFPNEKLEAGYGDNDRTSYLHAFLQWSLHDWGWTAGPCARLDGSRQLTI